MTPRERVRAAINRRPPDEIPLDLGSTSVTGIHAGAYAKLREAYGLRARPVRVVDPYQMLADVEEDVVGRLGIDTIGVQLPYTIFGFRNEGWKPWRLHDSTEVLVPGGFEYDVDERGDVLLYPEGDRTAAPSGRMPAGGYYFDAVVRQKDLDQDRLDPKRWVDETLARYTDEDARYLEETSRRAYEETDRAVVANFCDGGLGDIGIVPGLAAKDPSGVRDPEEWYVSLVTRKSYIRDIFAYQTELALDNLEVYRQACGDRVDIIDVSETDFGSQRGLLISRRIFTELFKPFMERINRWIHENTSWKVFYHSCGSIADIMEDFIDIGVDIVNPVQFGAEGMDLETLKNRFGDRLVFWGGGVDSQKTLPFGTPEEIAREVRRNVEALSGGGGFVFGVVHNLQANVPIQNMKALFDTLESLRGAGAA